MEISEKLMERLCKDTNIPIKVYKEPYFTSRLNLFEKQFQSKTMWDNFVKDILKFPNEQSYFEYYNSIKDNAINFIQTTEGYQKFLTFDMNKFKVPNYNIKRSEIFHHENDGKNFISIDLKKGNFTAFHYFDKSIVDNKDSYEEFISKFTDIEHIIKSKYIRQVIFGNCNPRRQTTIEKYLINMIIENTIIPTFGKDFIEVFLDDEVILKLDDILENYSAKIVDNFENSVKDFCKKNNINIHYENFKLNKINETRMYYKEFSDKNIEFKCVDSYEFPFIIRKKNKEEIQPEDKVFEFNGRLATFIE